MSQVIRLGIAGLGNAGQAVLRDLTQVSGITLGAVADVRKEALDSFRKRNDANTFDSVEAMCRSRSIDAVWIATPNEFHAEQVIAAARNGKHIVCEKPMAISLEECARMNAAVEANSVKLLMHSKAEDPPIVKMREVVASGRLGRVIQINSWNYKGWLDNPRLPPEVDTTKGGGVVYRQGAHQIDIVRCIGGGIVKSVQAITGKWHPSFDTEGNYTALLQFDDGTPATLVFNGYGGFDITEITWGIGEGGYVSSKRRASESGPARAVDASTKYAQAARAENGRREGERKQPFFGLTLVSCEKGDLRQSPDGLYLYTREGREELSCPPFLDRAGELMRLHKAVLGNQQVFTDGKWGEATLEVVLAILQSSKEARAISLSRQVRSF